MSDPALYINLYARLRDCAELIDDVIVDLEARSTTEPSRRRALSGLLRELDTAPQSNIDATMVWNVLREQREAKSDDWKDVADALDQGDNSDRVIERLEHLARVLEVERAEMHSRIHGPNAR